MASLRFGEAQLSVCGQLERCAPYKMDDGGAGFSGAVAIIGRTYKFTANQELVDRLAPHVGRPVTIVGKPKAHEGNIKFDLVYQVFDQGGNQLYSMQAEAAPAAPQPAAAATGAGGVFGRKAAA